VKARKFHGWQILLWVGMLAGLGCAGFMEYYVQRHGDRAMFAYSVMSGSLLVVITLILITWGLGKKRTARN